MSTGLNDVLEDLREWMARGDLVYCRGSLRRVAFRVTGRLLAVEPDRVALASLDLSGEVTLDLTGAERFARDARMAPVEFREDEPRLAIVVLFPDEDVIVLSVKVS